MLAAATFTDTGLGVPCVEAKFGKTLGVDEIACCKSTPDAKCSMTNSQRLRGKTIEVQCILMCFQLFLLNFRVVEVVLTQY